ncbi:MAG: hypothetical protein LBR73_06935 [Oscillospiraceae bacterium]|nr:hypothetical protein [Oscillospiraceae bacterium]
MRKGPPVKLTLKVLFEPLRKQTQESAKRVAALLTDEDSDNPFQSLWERFGKQILAAGAACIVLLVTVLGIGSYVDRNVVKATAFAEEASVYVGVDCTITIIRDETALEENTGGYLAPLVADGSRVSAGEILKVSCADETDASRLREIQSLKERIAQLEALAGEAPATLISAASLRRSAGSDWAAILDSVSAGELSAVSANQSAFMEHSAALESVRDGKEPDYSADIAEAKTKLTELNALTATESRLTVTAPIAGYYSDSSDGLESHLNLSSITRTVPGKTDGSREFFVDPNKWLQTVEKAKASAKPAASGKLVDGFHWYAVAVTDSTQAKTLSAGTSKKVRFPLGEAQDVTMKIEGIYDGGKGKAAVVLSCTAMEGFLTLREAQAQIVTDTVRGLRIPTKALRTKTVAVPGENDKDGNPTIAGYRTAIGVHIFNSDYVNFREVDIKYISSTDTIVRWNEPYEAQEVQGDIITVEGSGITVSYPNKKGKPNLLKFIGTNMFLTVQNTHYLSAVTGEETTVTTFSGSMTDEFNLEGDTIAFSQNGNTVTITGSGFVYKKVGHSQLKIYDRVVTEGRITDGSSEYTAA